MRRLFIILFCLGVSACEEAPLFSGTYGQLLNAPSSISLFPSTSLTLISNTNINLQESNGSIMAYDTATQTLLEDTRFFTTNFGTHPLIDAARSRILIPDLDQYLLFYTYQIPGAGGLPVSFAKQAISPAISSELSNAIEVDEIPSDIKLVTTQTHGEIYIVVNQQGTITVIDADDLQVKNLNDEARYQGLKLTSALNLGNRNKYPARGVSRLFHDPVSNLLFATSPTSNFIYVFDPENLENEGVLSLLSISGTTSGIRTMAIDRNQMAYIAHAGLESLIVIDLSQVTNNGILYEVIEPSVMAIIPLLGLPSDIVLNAAEDTVFVSLQARNEVVQIDAASLQVTGRTTLAEGTGPGTLFFDQARTEVLSLNSFSNSLTRLNAANLNEIEDIQ